MLYDIEKLKKHMQSHWVNGCPMCGNQSWSIHPDVEVFIPVDDKRGLRLTGEDVFPVILIKCDHCGYVALISPVLANAMK